MYLLLFYICACISSFCQLVAYRFIRQEDFIYGRSYCESCQHKLSIFETLPIISYIFLKGKCRHCHSKISVNHFILEILFAFMFLLIVIFHQFTLKTLIIINICMVLAVIAIIDWKTMYIYEVTIWLLFVLCIIYCYVFKLDLIFIFLGFLSISLPMLVIKIFFPHVIGLGDIQLLAVMGIILGLVGSSFAFYISVTSALVYALISKKTYKAKIPFAPFLCLGFFFALLLFC